VGSASTSKTNLLGMPRAELEAFVAGLGAKPFRARQLIAGRQQQLGIHVGPAVVLRARELDVVRVEIDGGERIFGAPVFVALPSKGFGG
jgi:hypothetical protein